MSNALCARPCADIAPTPIEWLWPGFLARGKLAVLDGDPGTGKSFLAVDLAARLSRGGPLPDGQLLESPHTTVLLNAEDDPADTVRPRVAAAGADLSRVFAAGGPNEPLPLLPGGVASITHLVYEHAASLLVIDPLAAFVPRSVANNPLRIRDALGPLTALAAETGCAMLVVRHRGGGSGLSAVYRGAGAGVLGLARTGLLLARHPDDPELRVLAVSKSNLGAMSGSLCFRLTPGGVLEWCGAVDLSADELCGVTAAQVSRRPRERAVEFLRDALASGPRPVSELEALAKERGLSLRTLDRAKQELRVTAKQERDGERSRWVWCDPSVTAIKSAAARAEINALSQLLFQKRDFQTSGLLTDRATQGAT